MIDARCRLRGEHCLGQMLDLLSNRRIGWRWCLGSFFRLVNQVQQVAALRQGQDAKLQGVDGRVRHDTVLSAVKACDGRQREIGEGVAAGRDRDHAERARRTGLGHSQGTLGSAGTDHAQRSARWNGNDVDGHDI